MRTPALPALVLAASFAAGAGVAATSPRPIDPPAAPGASAPALAVAAGDLVATWIEPARSAGHRVRASRLGPGGWGAPTTVAEGPLLLANWADTPGLVAGGDGSLYCWYLEKSPRDAHAYDALLSRSTDGGATFRPLGPLNDDRVPAEHGFVSAVSDGSGARFFYLDGRATPAGGATQLRSVRVAGERIAASELLDDSVCDCCPTAAVALPGGDVALAYRDRAAGEIRDVQLRRLGTSGAAAAPAVAGPDGWRIPGCPVNGPALASDGERLALAWFAAPGDRARVSVALSRDGGRSLGPAIRLDESGPLGRVAAAAIPGGFAVGWYATAGDRAELRVARVTADGRGGRPMTVARTAPGRASGVPRIVLWGERLAVAWSEPEPAPSRLRVALLEPAALPVP